MNQDQQRATASRRAGPLFGALLVVAAAMVVFAPVAPVARALDPTPVPSQSTNDTPPTSPDPGITPDPAASTAPSDAPLPSDTPLPSEIPLPSDAPSDAPSDVPLPSDAPLPSDTPVATPSETPLETPTPSAAPAGPVRVEHFWVSTLDQRGIVADKGTLDAPLTSAERFTVYLVRFQLVNVGADAVSVTPRLVAADASGAWSHVPAVDAIVGKPFYAAADDGRTFKARTEPLNPTTFRLDADSDTEGKAVNGASSAGDNPLAPITLSAHSFTEVEFAVRATVDAEWSTPYQLRLDDDRSPIDGSTVDVTMGAKPVIHVSPGSRGGTPEGDDATARIRIGVVFASTSRSGFAMTNAAPAQFTSPHTNYTLTSDFCAACHKDHSASTSFLGSIAAPSANLCFQCHDGTGANANVQAQFNSPALPANDATTSSYYSHPATQDLGHVTDRADEFSGTLNRHSVCVDCHQPHNADTTRPTETASGWTAPGTIMGSSSVSVVNGAAGAAPAYTYTPTTALEYQLCFKCHSGYTTLPTTSASHPSWSELDKAVELNPANVSYHPVEAQGKNQSDAIKLSLSGVAPGKLWAFTSTSTIRCTNCHGSPSSVAGVPGADATIDNHASTNRGILLANYRDRVLKSTPELYDPTDFSLCYLCHAETPMVDDSGDARYDTNFNWHGFHLNDIWFKGSGGTSIDKAGDGQSNALCAECHFRTHGTALTADGQTPAIGLVNFGPDVTPYNGVLHFTPATPTTLGSCTLTCHGKQHNNFRYQYGFPVP